MNNLDEIIEAFVGLGGLACVAQLQVEKIRATPHYRKEMALNMLQRVEEQCDYILTLLLEDQNKRSEDE